MVEGVRSAVDGVKAADRRRMVGRDGERAEKDVKVLEGVLD